tara:strand:- start:77 stop:676 length:600 start_codon:yes stop_codon:yes gene_type:complete
MVKQNINIIDFETLYNILEEIKINLSFEIYNYKNEDDFLNDLNNNNKDLTNSLIVLNSRSKNLNNHSEIDLRKIVILTDLPIEINKLVEKINVLLIKQRYNFQSKINIKNYILDLNVRNITINGNSLKLTEREIDVILFLNENKKPQKIDVLQSKIWGYSKGLETHTVETHIYRLRKKIKDAFQDDKFILSHNDGYLIE